MDIQQLESGLWESANIRRGLDGYEFKLTLFLHNLLTEDDHAWLRSFASGAVSDDEAKVLIYARETGVVDNSDCRDFCGLDTLAASQVLRRLRDRGLLNKVGAGSRTYYVLPHTDTAPELATLAPELATLAPELATLTPELATLLATLKGRAKEDALRQVIVRLCAWAPLTVEQLASLLGKSSNYLRNKHLIPMVGSGQLRFRYPESAKHPHQAYVAPVDIKAKQ